MPAGTCGGRGPKGPGRGAVALAFALALAAGGCGTAGAVGGPGAGERAERAEGRRGPKDPWAGAAPPAADGGARDGGAPARLRDVERRVHDLIGEERSARKLAPLRWDEALARIARAHSDDMVKRGYFGHVSPEGANFPERYARAGYRCAVTRRDGWTVEGGENVFAGNLASAFVLNADGSRTPEHLWTTEELARMIVGGWMASAGHRKNLLEPHWRAEGIGLAATRDGEVMVTQNFC